MTGGIVELYTQSPLERLVGLNNRYDPTNLFCMNQNIRPTVRQ
jgi:hypothetical protein